jgi:hypothetical protein
MKDLFGKCGCNCGHCLASKENAKTFRNRKKCSNGWRKYLGASIKPELCVCLGCQEEDPWKTGYMMPDRGCYIRPCAIALGITTCTQCGAYPCEDLRARIPGGDFRKNVAERMGRPVPEKDYIAFLEPYEGLVHLKALRQRLRSEDIMKMPKIAPLKAQIAAFPDHLVLSKAEIAGLESLYLLLKKIRTAQAATYARQIMIKRRRDLLLSILWIFGLYGKMEGKNGVKLVIRGTKDIPGHANMIIRKRDFAVHYYAAQSFRVLKSFGVNAVYNIRGKEWKLTMRFTTKAGGSVALKALQCYVRVLVEKYGKPGYAGSSRYKGKAFELFAKADMHILARKKAIA